VLLAWAFAALLLGSCRKEGPTLHPVRGKLLFQNQPADGATVVFHPTDPKAPKPAGRVAADGSFTLSTYPHGEGAPAGDYLVAVTWLPPNARDVENAKNRLPERYAQPGSSTLKATVKAGPNELEPFLLSK
jgi:hypothetical protein